MFDTSALSASAITALLPQLIISVPGYGTIDIRPVVAAVGMFVLLTAFFWLVRKVILERAKAWSARTSTEFDDVIVDSIRGVRPWVYTIAALFVSLQFFTLPELAGKVLNGVFLFAIIWQLIEVVTRFVDFFTTRFLEKDEDGDGVPDPNTKTMSNLVTLLSRIALWSMGILFVLSNVGIEVTSLLAGLGIGGIAIAFALQGILSDLFASFSIYFDKPFRIGDFIIVGADMGTVEHIGIKSTRLRTLEGQELVISNAELTTARVNNYKKMEERRIVLKLGVTYETPQEKLKQIPGIIERIFSDIENARLDRAHFASFADFALIFEIVFYVESADYAAFMDIQQHFNFTLMERFAELGIDFAYPTQLVYTKQIAG